jgi:hypothetical protein
MTWKAILPFANLKENWYTKFNLILWHDKDEIPKHLHKDFQKNVPTTPPSMALCYKYE